MRWRLVLLDGDGPFNMGLDEAILNSVSRGESPPTLRLYAFRPSAVTIGRFQRVRESVDLDAARRLGVPVVRR
ncbi:MAG TPA: lipoate--protein ligase family protein, partial [Candidatus Korarchaeota archaeon]|nr:lipoate--protein ligase family protein [Candidatus Korarchaeota archaeon]